ncbi:MAG: hypothetical protein R3C53_13540 [Pirellulaceae bacterium]
MKLSNFSRCQWGLMLALATGLTTTGCRSAGGWKMPGTSMFASREPDAATLVGRDDVPELPVSPASKYSPDNIASVGTKPNSSTTTPTTGGAYGFPAQTVSTPKAGLAAAANGYQTGPYQVGGAGSTAANTAGLTTGTAGGTTSGYPGTYGGSYGGASSQPNVELPKSVTGALAQAQAAMPSYPSSYGNSTPSYNGTGGYGPAPETTAAAPPSASTQYPGYPTSPTYNPTASMSAAVAAAPAIPSPSGLLPSVTVGSRTEATLTIPPMSGANANTASYNSGTTTSISPQPSSAYQGATTLGGFTPGTTGRSTTYDFSPGANNTSAASGTAQPATTNTLPPNTATLPGYQSSPSLR